MGKGRTLAGFVVENIARGRRKHVWISVSADLYEGELLRCFRVAFLWPLAGFLTDLIYVAFTYQDAKRDLRDLGLGTYAESMCHNLGKLPYGSLWKHKEGVIFATYQTLISKNREGDTRLDELVDWCGGEEFDGLVM